MIGVGAASFVAVRPVAEDDDAMIDQTEGGPENLTDPFDDVQVTTDHADPVEGTLHAGLLEDLMFSSEENGAVTDSGAAPWNAVADEAAVQDGLSNEEAFDFSTYDGPEFTYFMTGDWINQAHGAEVIDYEATQESLLVVWDDTDPDAQEPSVSVSPDPDDPEVMQINMNGKVLAEVYGDSNLSAGDLTLIPLSSALIVELPLA